MILVTVLSKVRDPQELNAALRAYDEVRRPRTQRIVESSKTTGTLICGRGAGVGLDVEKLRTALGGRWGFTSGLDMAEHKQDALSAMIK
jgi:salicylate hydroxylase